MKLSFARISMIMLLGVTLYLPSYAYSENTVEINQLLNENKLTAAAEKLREALQLYPSNPGYLRLNIVLKKKINFAKLKYEKYKGAARKFQFENALNYINQARLLWSDNENYEVARNNLKRVMDVKDAPQESCIDCGHWGRGDDESALCTERLAGYGKRKRGTCFYPDPEGLRPILVVLPAGGRYDSPFVITKHEISVKNYNHYCSQSSDCQPIDGNSKRPVTGLSFKEAKTYTAWLSDKTGKKYSIPTTAQWLYAASSGGKDKEPIQNVNCTERHGERPIKGSGLKNIDAGEQNMWGLMNHIGNAQEWVIGNNGDIYAVGGSFNDDIKVCSINLKRKHSGEPDHVTGFRLVREL